MKNPKHNFKVPPLKMDGSCVNCGLMTSMQKHEGELVRHYKAPKNKKWVLVAPPCFIDPKLKRSTIKKKEKKTKKK